MTIREYKKFCRCVADDLRNREWTVNEQGMLDLEDILLNYIEEGFLEVNPKRHTKEISPCSN